MGLFFKLVNEMKKIEIKVEGWQDLSFTGELLARIESSWLGRWEALTLYRTEGEKFICVKQYVTCWKDDNNSSTIKTVEKHQDVIDFFGFGKMAKELYEKAGIDAVKLVE